MGTSFDARNEWPDCIHGIENQQTCGSCWAFSSVGFFQDRLCIATDGKISTKLSYEDMVTCDYKNYGCDGGMLSETLQFLEVHGVTTSQCKKYHSTTGVNGFCKYWCDDWNTEYKKYYCKMGSNKILTSAQEIQEEIMNNGPMQVAYQIYSDFTNYEAGVYSVTSGATVTGGHAVKLIGWDYDSDGNLYWICQN